MRQFIVLLFVFGSLPLAWADDSARKSNNNEMLGFDASKIEPPGSGKGDPIARVFYDFIYPAELEADSRKLTDDQARRLTGLILGRLKQRYIEQHKITATPDEVQQFLLALEELPATEEEGVSEKEKEAIRNAAGAEIVKGWKFDRALYQRFGGTVIFQQGNPVEPVGAYRKFLEQLEKAKVFEVYDEENRTKFWHYFTRKHPFPLPPEKVNFEKPWWMQKR